MNGNRRSLAPVVEEVIPSFKNVLCDYCTVKFYIIRLCHSLREKQDFFWTILYPTVTNDNFSDASKLWLITYTCADVEKSSGGLEDGVQAETNNKYIFVLV